MTRICNDFCENFGQWGDDVKNLALDFVDIYWVYVPTNIFTKEDKDKNLIHFNWRFSKQSAKNVQTLGVKMGLFRMICSRLGYLG